MMETVFFLTALVVTLTLTPNSAYTAPTNIINVIIWLSGFLLHSKCYFMQGDHKWSVQC